MSYPGQIGLFLLMIKGYPNHSIFYIAQAAILGSVQYPYDIQVDVGVVTVDVDCSRLWLLLCQG
jgi:hypothetical protein